MLQRLIFVLLFAGLLLVRVPSLAQPAGADQGLYAYVGQVIRDGGLPYRDAWDQKPPGIHFVYAGLFSIYPHEGVVPAADLAAAGLIALLLVPAGRRLADQGGAGEAAALLFLLLGNPAFTRLAGVRVRAQCETFIALAVAGAVAVLIAGADRRWQVWRAGAAGVLLGIAILLKYNAAVYVLPLAALALLGGGPPGTSRERPDWRSAGVLAAAAGLPALGMAAWFAAHGALGDLFDATILYNLRYSGETYGGPAAFARYLLTFPVLHARIDSLWLLGGAGCALLLVVGWGRPQLLVPVGLVAAASLSIAINGSRGLPQYFVQAHPFLALAAGVAGAWVWMRTTRRARVVLALAIAVAVWRVTPFPRLVEATAYDWAGLTGARERESYLARFGRVDSDEKYSALAVQRLADYLRVHSAPGEPVLVFGFSGWAYVGADRRSASRYFWSRPVIVGTPDAELATFRAEIAAARPAVVALQRRDWDPVETNSDEFFLSQPALRGWLLAHYEPAGELHNYLLWTRRRPA